MNSIGHNHRVFVLCLYYDIAAKTNAEYGLDGEAMPFDGQESMRK